MAQRQETPDYSELKKYEYANLAAEFMKSEETRDFVPGALENLVGSKGLNLSKDAIGVMTAFGTFDLDDEASIKRITRGISTYNARFEKAKGSFSPAALAGWYGPLLSDLDEDSRKKINDYLMKNGKGYGSMIKAIADAENTLDPRAAEGKFTDEQKEAARKTRDKYAMIIQVIQLLDKYKRELLRPAAASSTRKQNLKDLASQLD